MQFVTTGSCLRRADADLDQRPRCPRRFILESNAMRRDARGRGSVRSFCDLRTRRARLAATGAPGAGDVMTVLGARAMRASALTAGIGG